LPLAGMPRRRASASISAPRALESPRKWMRAPVCSARARARATATVSVASGGDMAAFPALDDGPDRQHSR